MQVAGGADEAVMQPAWGPDGHLYFISDAPSGWWNIFREQDGKVGGAVWACVLVCDLGGQHGWAQREEASCMPPTKVMYDVTAVATSTEPW